MLDLRLDVAPGAVHLRGYLGLAEQSAVASRCVDLGAQAAGFYVPIVRGGHPMSVQMLCLGRHWNANRYAYEDVRSDVDGLPAPQLPREFIALAERAAIDAGFHVTPDLCIVNWYRESSRM